MGRYKGEGVCWSGKCRSPAEPTGATDSEGHPFQLCTECKARVGKHLGQLAWRYAGERMRLAKAKAHNAC